MLRMVIAEEPPINGRILQMNFDLYRQEEIPFLGESSLKPNRDVQEMAEGRISLGSHKT
jgi:hypothetical protein